MVGTPGSISWKNFKTIGPVRWNQLSENMRVIGVEGRRGIYENIRY